MRILAIRGQNLASLAQPFALELGTGPLARTGLFAIVGPVGAGKTTLLDALCLALFDRTPRLSGRGGMAVGDPGEAPGDWLRSNDPRTLLRRDAAEAWAEVDFSGRDGRRYRSRWTVRRARRRADGRVQDQEMILRDLDADTVVASGRKTEVLAAIGERLGLDFAQFCRSVVLAQGDFAAFLRATPDERARLLENLTGADVYRKLSRAAHQRRKQCQAEVERLGGQFAAVGQLDDAARQALHERVAALDGDRKAAQAGIEIARRYLLWYETAANQREEEAKAQARLQEAITVNDTATAARRRHERLARAIVLAPRAEVVAERQQVLFAARAALATSAQNASDAAQRVQALEGRVRDAVQAVLPGTGDPPPIVRDHAVWVGALQRWWRSRAQARQAAGQIAALQRAAEAGAARLAGLQAGVAAAEAAADAAAAALRRARQAVEEPRFAALAVQRQAVAASAAALRREADRLRAWGDAEARCAAVERERESAELRERQLAAALPNFAEAATAAGLALEAARAARDRARVHGAAAALRHHLVDGEPCPLCGSPEHPAPAVGDAANVRAAEAQAGAAEHAADQARQQQRERELQLAQAKAAVAAATETRALAQQAAAVARAAWREVAPPEVRELAPAAAAGEFAARQRAQAGAEASLQELEAAAAKAAKEYEAARSAEREAVAAQRGRHAEFGDAERAAEVARQQVEQAQRELAAAGDAVRALGDELAPAFGERDDWLERVEALGADPSATFATLATDWQQLAQARDAARAAAAVVTQAGNDETRAELEFAQASAALTKALADGALHASEVREAMDLGAPAIAAEGERLRLLAVAVEQARAVLAQCGEVRRRHESTSSPTLAEADAVQALEEARTAHKRLDDQLTEARSHLRADDLLRRQRDELAPRLAAAEAQLHVWAALDDLIGSSTGDAFVVFAQGLTLDLLLAEANRRLAELARRYRLQKNEGEMDFVVVDLDLGGTRRSLQTLSGGESFLVSLALALALATLAAPRARVETLFLDEGFGTLDAQHLETALGALDALQAVGCQVGVISHVDGIAERIGAVVDVRPEGGGRSRVVTRLS